jgi:hypothetical protein
MNKTKKCSHCKLDIDSKATRCPHCQSDLRSWINRHPIGTIILLIVFVPMMIFSSSSSTPVSKEESTLYAKQHAVASFSKSYVEGVLKAPSTAKFGTSPSITQDEKDKNVFEVISHVDSENGFGAMIRSTWSVKARYIGGDTEDDIWNGPNWRIVEIWFDGKKIK